MVAGLVRVIACKRATRGVVYAAIKQLDNPTAIFEGKGFSDLWVSLASQLLLSPGRTFRSLTKGG